MGKYGVIVLDSFGVGAMDDVPKVRPDDIGANTALNIIKAVPQIKIPNLEMTLNSRIFAIKFDERYWPRTR